MTLDGFEKFLKHFIKKNGDKLLPSTIDRYEEMIYTYVDDLDKINDKEQLIEYINSKLKIRPSHVLYSAFRNYLRYKGYEDSDEIFAKIKAPRKRANAQTSIRFLQSKIFTPKEVKRLIDEAQGILKIAIAFMFDTACRRSELLNVRWGDITFIENPDDNIYAEVRLLGKGQKTRTVYLTRSTANMLKEIKEDDVKKKVFVFYEDEKNKRRPFKYQSDKLYKEIRKLGKEVLGRKLSPHFFRNSRAQFFANQGADILGISNLLGHQNISTSQIYLKNSSAIGKKMFEKFSDDVGDYSND